MPTTWQIDRPQLQELGGAGEPIVAVHVVLVSGRLDVVAQPDRSSARLDVRDVAGRPLAVSLAHGTLRVEHHKDAGGNVLDMLKGMFTGATTSSAQLTLTVPATAKVTVTTVSADALVSCVTGDVTINTVSGALSLARLSGRVDVKTVSSSIDASGLAGELRSKSVSGRLTVDESALRSAKLATVSGPLVLDLVGSTSLVTATGISADITIRIPRDSGYDVSAGSQSGHVVVDGHTLSGGEGAEKGGHRSLGDRTFAIKARTVSGNVVVLRDGSASAGLGAAGLRPLSGDASDVQDVRRPADGNPEGSPHPDRSDDPTSGSRNADGPDKADSGAGSGVPGPNGAAGSSADDSWSI